MKFVHLSDLHIGKIVNNISMIEEQKHAFEQIIRCIQTEKPAAAVIAGDVYDRAVPGVEAVQLFDDFLTELAGLDTAVLLISGNHDSPERIGYASRLLTEKRLHICGAFDGSIHKAVLSDGYGEVNFWLLPFIKPAYVYGMFGEGKTETHGDAVAAALESAGIDYSARNVLVSHQYYTKAGVSLARSDSELNPIGGLDGVDCALIEQFDYAALGHLHQAQSAGFGHIRYAGSPVKYSFSEIDHKKSVTVVELKEKGDLSVNLLPISPIHDMREIKGRLADLLCDGFSSAQNKDDYLRVIYTDEEYIADAAAKIRAVYPNMMENYPKNSRSDIDVGEIKTSIEKIEKMSQYELFSEFFLEMQGSAMSVEQSKIVQELLDGKDETAI